MFISFLKSVCHKIIRLFEEPSFKIHFAPRLILLPMRYPFLAVTEHGIMRAGKRLQRSSNVYTIGGSIDKRSSSIGLTGQIGIISGGDAMRQQSLHFGNLTGMNPNRILQNPEMS